MAPVWWLGRLRVVVGGVCIWFWRALVGRCMGPRTDGLKARGAARHKKSRLSAGCVGAAASGAHIKNPVFGRVCWGVCRRGLLYKKYPRFLAGGVFYYLITSLIILYALGLVLVNFTALANRAKPSSKRFLSDAYRVATTSPFLTASPHFLCNHSPAP